MQDTPIYFGNWSLHKHYIENGNGYIPLSQISAITKENFKLDRSSIAFGTFAILIAVSVYFYNNSLIIFSIISFVVGALFVAAGIVATIRFRAYSSSGFYFEIISSSIDIGNNREKLFKIFAAEVIRRTDEIRNQGSHANS